MDETTDSRVGADRFSRLRGILAAVRTHESVALFFFSKIVVFPFPMSFSPRDPLRNIKADDFYSPFFFLHFFFHPSLDSLLPNHFTGGKTSDDFYFGLSFRILIRYYRIIQQRERKIPEKTADGIFWVFIGFARNLFWFSIFFLFFLSLDPLSFNV